MSKTVLQSIAFFFGLNLMFLLIPVLFPTVFTEEFRAGTYYQQNFSNTFTGGMQSVITPSGEAENIGNRIYRVLDLTIIGFIERFFDAINTYLFSFIQFLDVIVGGMMLADNPELWRVLFAPVGGILYLLSYISYIYAAFTLWTGKDVLG